MYRFMIFIEKSWQAVREFGHIILAISVASRLHDIAKKISKLNESIKKRSAMEISEKIRKLKED